MHDLVLISLIFLSFALVHSLTVTRTFKQICTQSFDAEFMRIWYRFLYTCLSMITLTAAFVLIRRIPDVAIWQGPPSLSWLLSAVRLSALFFGALVFEHLDAGEFLGLKQVWRYMLRGEVSGNEEGMSEKGLVTGGVYGVVRHPMYLAGIIIFTFEPNVTRNGVLVTVLADLYFLAGAVIEDRRLTALFGREYREYREQVPMLLPRVACKKG